MEDEGWALNLQWIPLHCNIPGNERADVLAASAYGGAPSVRLERIHVARIIFHEDVLRRHPHPGVSNGSPPILCRFTGLAVYPVQLSVDFVLDVRSLKSADFCRDSVTLQNVYLVEKWNT